MASRRAGRFADDHKRAARASLESAFSLYFEGSVGVLADHAPNDDTQRRMMLFEADTKEIEAKRKDLPKDVILEPEILHYPTSDRIYGMRLKAKAAESIDPGTGLEIKLTVRAIGGGAGSALKGCEVILYFRSNVPGLQGQRTQTTDGNGRVTFAYSPVFTPAAALVMPRGDFWPMVVRAPQTGAVVLCPALPAAGPVAWWHQMVGLNDYAANRGAGITIGIADSGRSSHPALAHTTDTGAFIGGGHDPNGGADVDRHGSHVCGIITARPSGKGYMGAAPGASVFTARVFPPGEGANQLDIANAIEHLSRQRKADLINLSLGSPNPSEVERDAIQDALERGTLCICAAANSAGPVEYPAAFNESVAISALGELGWGPDGSLSSTRMPQDADRYGERNLYLASFSCFGPQIAACAPGVGILSTVTPFEGSPAPFGAMDGTSMASPLACGTLAVRLSNDAAYKNLPRNLTRAAMARQILQNGCRNIGLKAEYQGRGLIVI